MNQHCLELPIHLGQQKSRAECGGGGNSSPGRARKREGIFLPEDWHGQKLKMGKCRVHSEPWSDRGRSGTISAHWLSPLEPCSMQLSAHNKFLISVAVVTHTACTRVSETIQLFLSLTVGQPPITHPFIQQAHMEPHYMPHPTLSQGDLKGPTILKPMSSTLRVISSSLHLVTSYACLLWEALPYTPALPNCQFCLRPDHSIPTLTSRALCGNNE